MIYASKNWFLLLRKDAHVEIVGAWDHFIDVFRHENSLFCLRQIQFTFASIS